MAWTAKRVRIAGEALREAFARLADVAPDRITVLTEDSDWGLVGGDFRAAMEAEAAELEKPAEGDREELVEA